MKTIDAYEWFIDHRPIPLMKRTCMAYAHAERALEKEISREPKFRGRELGVYCCPVCGAPLGPEFRYCSFCGQHLDRKSDALF